MSAYIVDREQIVALVTYLGRSRYNHSDLAELSAMGRTLWSENLKSIEHRYPDTAETHSNYPGPIDLTREDVTGFELTRADQAQIQHRAPVEILKTCSCLSYQSCEHPGWENSEAHQLLSRIRQTAINQLPGYEDAWGW